MCVKHFPKDTIKEPAKAPLHMRLAVGGWEAGGQPPLTNRHQEFSYKIGWPPKRFVAGASHCHWRLVANDI